MDNSNLKYLQRDYHITHLFTLTMSHTLAGCHCKPLPSSRRHPWAVIGIHASAIRQATLRPSLAYLGKYMLYTAGGLCAGASGTVSFLD